MHTLKVSFISTQAHTYIVKKNIYVDLYNNNIVLKYIKRNMGDSLRFVIKGLIDNNKNHNGEIMNIRKNILI